MKKNLLTILLLFILPALTNAHVELIQPKANEVFTPAETVNIEWNELVSHNTLNWDLYFSADGGESWTAIKTDISYETTSYTWTVPETFTTQGQIKIVQDNEGFNYEDISGNFTISAATAVGKQSSKTAVKIYPNPFIFSTTISFNNPEQETHTLFIYDTKGRMAKKSTSITNGKISITREGLNSGLYYFQLHNNKKLKYSGKLIVK
jgi:hypothetical protein